MHFSTKSYLKNNHYHTAKHTLTLFLAKQTNIKKRKKESPFLIASNPMVSFHPTNEKKKRKAMVFISNVCSL